MRPRRPRITQSAPSGWCPARRAWATSWAPRAPAQKPPSSAATARATTRGRMPHGRHDLGARSITSRVSRAPSARLHGRRRVEARRAHPARLGHVHSDPVRARVLHLDVRVAGAAAHAEGGFDVVALRGAGRRQLLGDLLKALDLEAEVMDAGPVLAPLDAGHRVVLELEDGGGEIAGGGGEAPRVR